MIKMLKLKVSIIIVSLSDIELGSSKSGWVCEYKNSGAKYNCIWLQNLYTRWQSKGGEYLL